MTQATLAEELGRHIERRGYTPERLVRESRISKATLHRWLAGTVKKPYYWENLLAVINALNLSKVDADRLLLAAQLPTVDTLIAGATPEQLHLFKRWATPARNNLPSGLTSFVGRQDETIEIAGLLSREDVRLVTLTGPGGAGKTRLSLRVANELHDVFPDGIFFVALAAVSDAAQVIASIARTLEIRDVPGQAIGERLVDYLRERQMLLVLDNVEHLVDAAPDIVELLSRVQHVTVLVTSRIPLRVSCEHERPVPLLGLPAGDADLDTVSDSPSVTLFVDRARAVSPGFNLEADNAGSVVEICERLEGSPLAIELAAARCRQYLPPELLERFPSRLDLGSDGPRDLPQRQRSLRAMIGWSYHLLPPESQTLFRRLAVFAGGWTERAAIAVCGGSSMALGELVESNLVERVAGDRYRMLETIREYALEQLAGDSNGADIRQAHTLYFLDLAAARELYIPQTRQSDWLERIDRDLDNVRAALEWATGQKNDELALRLAAALWPYWHEYGHFREGLGWLEIVIAIGDDYPPAWMGSALTGAFLLSYSISDIPRAKRYSDEALRVWREVGDWHGAALVLDYLGLIQYTTSGSTPEDFVRAGQLFQESLMYWQRVNHPLGVASSLSSLGTLLTITGRFEDARSSFAQAEAIYRREDDGVGVARIVCDGGLLALLQGDLTTAIPLLQNALAMCKASEAATLAPWCLFYLGTSYCFVGELDLARERLSESLRTFHETGMRYGVSYVLLGFAALALREGRLEDAATLCGAVKRALDLTGIAMNPAVQEIYLRETNSLRAALGDAGFERSFSSGRDMSIDEAVRFGLGDPVVS